MPCKLLPKQTNSINLLLQRKFLFWRSARNFQIASMHTMPVEYLFSLLNLDKNKNALNDVMRTITYFFFVKTWSYIRKWTWASFSLSAKYKPLMKWGCYKKNILLLLASVINVASVSFDKRTKASHAVSFEAVGTGLCKIRLRWLKDKWVSDS